jgi:MFS family permease
MRVLNKQLLTLRALFAAMASIQLVTAASGTLVALDFAESGASQEAAALAPAFYSLGFLVGCFRTSGWITQIGHIRSFAAGAAICIASTLIFALTEFVPVLLGVRFTTGLATAALFAIGDAWVSQSADGNSRGRLLAIYAILLGALSVGSQVLIPFLPDDLNVAFVVVSLLYCLAIVILTAARTDPPSAHADASVRLKAVFRDSPTAWLGSFTVGIIGALYLGRIVFMYPLGWASDFYDRRRIIVANGWVASAVLLYLSIAGSGDGSGYRAVLGTNLQLVLLGLLFVLGGALLTAYSLLVAHAMDRTVPVYVGSTTVTLLFVWTMGAVAGPLLASLVSAAFGDEAASWLLTFLMVSYTSYVLVRLKRAKASDRAEKTAFVSTETSSLEVAPSQKKKAKT